MQSATARLHETPSRRSGPRPIPPDFMAAPRICLVSSKAVQNGRIWPKRLPPPRRASNRVAREIRSASASNSTRVFPSIVFSAYKRYIRVRTKFTFPRETFCFRYASVERYSFLYCILLPPSAVSVLVKLAFNIHFKLEIASKTSSSESARVPFQFLLRILESWGYVCLAFLLISVG